MAIRADLPGGHAAAGRPCPWRRTACVVGTRLDASCTHRLFDGISSADLGVNMPDQRVQSLGRNRSSDSTQRVEWCGRCEVGDNPGVARTGERQRLAVAKDDRIVRQPFRDSIRRVRAGPEEEIHAIGGRDCLASHRGVAAPDRDSASVRAAHGHNDSAIVVFCQIINRRGERLATIQARSETCDHYPDTGSAIQPPRQQRCPRKSRLLLLLIRSHRVSKAHCGSHQRPLAWIDRPPDSPQIGTRTMSPTIRAASIHEHREVLHVVRCQHLCGIEIPEVLVPPQRHLRCRPQHLNRCPWSSRFNRRHPRPHRRQHDLNRFSVGRVDLARPPRRDLRSDLRRHRLRRDAVHGILTDGFAVC